MLYSAQVFDYPSGPNGCNYTWRQQEIHAERDQKLEAAAKTAKDSAAEGRVKNEEPTIRVAVDVDNQ